MKRKEPHKILIVDDEEKNRKVLGVMLAHHGYDFDTAASGAEALVKVAAYAPDLIFLDIMMPEMDGYAVCRELKKDAATSEIPVVMVTALADRESRLKGLDAGASDFLIKPFDKNELMLRTKNLVQVKDFSDFLRQHNERLEEEVALRSARPYRPAFDHEKTCSIIIDGDGRTMPGHFDPAVHAAFSDLHEKFAGIYEDSRN